jgi:hypothetical protein
MIQTGFHDNLQKNDRVVATEQTIKLTEPRIWHNHAPRQGIFLLFDRLFCLTLHLSFLYLRREFLKYCLEDLMKKRLLLPTVASCLVALSVSCDSGSHSLHTTDVRSAVENEDSYLWLEEIESPQALDFVRSQNARATGELQGDGRFQETSDGIASILSSKDKLQYVWLL